MVPLGSARCTDFVSLEIRVLCGLPRCVPRLSVMCHVCDAFHSLGAVMHMHVLGLWIKGLKCRQIVGKFGAVCMSLGVQQSQMIIQSSEGPANEK